MKIHDIWRSGLVRRWHSNPDMADTCQTNGHHQWAVSVIALYLFGDNLDLIKASLLHDVAEVGIGDVSGLAKRLSPELKTAIDEAESANAVAMGVEYETSDKLKLCDMIEAYLWVRHHNPNILKGYGWPEQVEEIFAISKRLGVFGEVSGIVL